MAHPEEDCVTGLSTVFTVSLLTYLNLHSNSWLSPFVSQYYCIILMLLVSPIQCSRTEHAWNMKMYKIYGVSGNILHLIYAYTNCVPLSKEALLRQCMLLRNCCKINNGALRFIYECFGHMDLYSCMLNLSIDDLSVYNMWSCCIR